MIAVVLEADPLARAFVRSILELEGFDVLEGATVLEGAALAARSRPDLVLSGLDLGGGDLDGLDLVRAIRATGATAAVLASDLPPTCDAVRSVTDTGARHLALPYTPASVGRAVRSALAWRAAPGDRLPVLA